MRYLLFIYLIFTTCPPKSDSIWDPTEARPNILILFTDDQRWNTIGAWGNDEIQTPNLDRLAKIGTSFTRAHVTGGNHGAICAFSRAMLLTGMNFQNIPPSFANPTTGECPFLTMPQVFRKNGYKTYFTGKWHNNPPELVAGFDEGKNIFLGGMHFPKEGGHFRPKLFDSIDSTGAFPTETKKQRDEFSSKLYADAAIDFIKNHQGLDPFFIYTAFTSPHDPRTPPPPFDKMYNPAKIKLPPNFKPEHPFDMGILKMRDEELLPYPRTADDVRREIALYYGMVSEVDTEIGRILDALEASGKMKNTIIVFAGDNGLAVGQHGLLGKQNLYDHSVRVPLIFAGPKIPKNLQATALCSIHDIFPTLAEMCSIQLPENVEGVSLEKALREPALQFRDDLLLSYTSTQRALRTKDDWKFIWTNFGGQTHQQLFNLSDDPWEQNDLSDDPLFAAKKAALQSLLLEKINTGNDAFLSPAITVKYEQFGIPPIVEVQTPGDFEVRYTLDGSTPTLYSPIANGPIDLIENTVFTAQTYFQGKPASPIVTEEIWIANKFAGLILETEPSPKYAANASFTLADHQRGDLESHHKKWLGYQGNNCIITVDLGEKKDISKVKVGFLNKPDSWIFPPQYISVISARNSEHYTTECEWGTTSPTPADNNPYLDEAIIKCNIQNTRWLKIKIENLSICPTWHPGNGKPAWLFIDEIWVE